MLYTVISESDLFFAPAPKRKTVRLGHLLLEGIMDSSEFTVCRLITTDLNEYLYGTVLPGQTIDLNQNQILSDKGLTSYATEKNHST